MKFSLKNHIEIFVKLQHEINFQIKIYPTVLLLLVVFWKPTCHKNRGRIRHLLPLREAPFLKLYMYHYQDSLVLSEIWITIHFYTVYMYLLLHELNNHWNYSGLPWWVSSSIDFTKSFGIVFKIHRYLLSSWCSSI